MTTPAAADHALDGHQFVALARTWAQAAGFQRLAVAHLDLGADYARLEHWLARGLHGSMSYLERHGDKRATPDRLVPGTLSVLSVRADYLRAPVSEAIAALEHKDRGYVSRYALGRDYHKTLRRRLATLADRLREEVGGFGYRVFTDSAPVLERALARNAGLGWIGKHTNLIDRDNGSLFFLGEIFTDLPLPADAVPSQDHCGSCTRCIDVCPTAAIIAPYELDARRCISYLTIESKDPIPESLRPLIGNRIFGCDDCQLFCPWNRYAKLSPLDDFDPRHGLDGQTLTQLFALSATDFDEITRGSPIRRISHEQWLRNIAVALGNAPTTTAVITALETRREHPSALVREHVAWALARHRIAATDDDALV